MTVIEIILNPDGALNDLADRERRQAAGPVKVILVDGGMESGRDSITLAFELADGSLALAETSARNFLLAAKAIEARAKV